MTTKELTLLATYGACAICGAPRDSKTTSVSGPTGFTFTTRGLVCTADETHSQDNWPDDFRGFGTNVRPPKQR